MSELAYIFSIDGFGKNTCGWNYHADESLSLVMGEPMYYYRGKEVRMYESVVWGSDEKHREKYEKFFEELAGKSDVAVFFSINILYCHAQTIKKLFKNIFVLDYSPGHYWGDLSVFSDAYNKIGRIVRVPKDFNREWIEEELKRQRENWSRVY